MPSNLALQPGVERLGHGEIARYDLDGRRQPRGIRSPRERAHRHARAQQLVYHRTPDPAGGSRHEDGMHACACHEGLDGVRRTAKLRHRV